MSDDRALYTKALDGSFRAFNDEAVEFAASVKVGRVVALEGVRVRNGQYHKLYFAILKLIAENSNPPISRKAALHFAKVAAGVGEFIDDSKGERWFVPGSISFAKMDQAGFEAFVQSSIPPLVGRFMRGTAPDELVAEAMALAA